MNTAPDLATLSAADKLALINGAVLKMDRATGRVWVEHVAPKEKREP